MSKIHERVPLVATMEQQTQNSTDVFRSTSDETDALEPVTTFACSPTRRANVLKIGFSAGSILCSLGLYASTPVYTTIMSEVSDIYCLLVMTGLACPLMLIIAWLVQRLMQRKPVYFITDTPFKTLFLCGFLSTVQNIVVVLASLPSRTPSYLYPLLNPAIIPATAFARFIMIRKGITIRQIICCGVVMLGVFVSAVPTIFSLPVRPEDYVYDADTGKTNRSTTTTFFWPTLILIAQIPVAINYVIYETGAQRHTTELLLFYFWTQFFGFFWVLLLFWTDIIPGFGQAASLHDFFNKMTQSLQCHLGLSESLRGCSKVPLVFFLNSLSYVGADVFVICIMAVSEGSVFSTLVGCLCLPLSSFFWLLFKFDEKDLVLLWEPIIHYTALFPLLGLCLLLPATIYYELSSAHD